VPLGRYEIEKKCTQGLCGKTLKKKEGLEDLGVDGRVI
jgi:hypothetical protein